MLTSRGPLCSSGPGVPGSWALVAAPASGQWLPLQAYHQPTLASGASHLHEGRGGEGRGGEGRGGEGRGGEGREGREGRGGEGRRGKGRGGRGTDLSGNSVRRGEHSLPLHETLYTSMYTMNSYTKQSTGIHVHVLPRHAVKKQ